MKEIIMNTMLKTAIAFLLGVLIPTVSVAQAQAPRDVSRDVAMLSEQMKQFTVKVYARPNPDKPDSGWSTGSGELIRSADGTVRIVTNQHVVGSLAETVFVHFDGQPFAQEVRVIGRDELVDLALLEVPSPLPYSAKPITIARTPLVVGQIVYAIGYPSGNRNISVGIINSQTSPQEDSGIGIYFTHQAPISPGSSGGLLVRFTSSGEPELIGINTQVAVGSGGFITNVSYSLKHEVIQRMLPKLESGLVGHAFAGVVLSDTSRASPYAFPAYPPPQKGIVVMMVAPGSPAHRAGIIRGDMIRKVEKEISGRWENITTDTAADLRDRIFFDVTPGTVVRMTILRGKEESMRTLTLERFAPDSLNPKKRP